MISKKQLIHNLNFFYQELLLPFITNKQLYLALKKDWEKHIENFLLLPKIDIYKKLKEIARYTPDPENYLSFIIFELESDIFQNNPQLLKENLSPAEYEKIKRYHNF